MKFNFLKSLSISLVLIVGSYTNVAKAGLINDIDVETISYQVTSGIYGWNASYDISFIDQDLIIDVDVFLTGFSADSSLLDIWEQGIESLWSSAFDLFDGNYFYDTVFNIDWLDIASGADHIIEVHEGTGRFNSANFYTDDSLMVQPHPDVAAHEFGHLLGLYDEYNGGALNPENLIDSTSIMGSGRIAKERHFTQFTDWISGNTNLGGISLVDDQGDHHYSVSVPEPSTLAIFVLGMIGLASRRLKQ